MRYTELLEARQGSLYHAMNLEHYESAIKNNRLLATSIQRYDESGRIIADPDFKYDFYKPPEKIYSDPNISDAIKDEVRRWYNSNWYLGISTTRDINFASNWKDVIFELDYTKLSQNYKIIPWNWGSSKNKYKSEREEFIVLKKNAKDYVDSKKFLKPDESNPKLPLSKYLKGIYLSKKTWEIYTRHGTEEYEPISKVQTHPLYKGIV